MVSCHNALRLTLHLTATAFVIAFLLSTATAQKRLDGRVITSDSIPVHNAIVQLRLQEDTTKSFRTLTDSDGRFTFLLTTVESMGTAKDFALHPNYPNPFSSSTTISFSISQRESVTLSVYDLLGRQVRTLVSEQLEAGMYRVDWDGRDEATKQLSQGAYVSVLQTKNGIATGRLMLSGERQTDKPKTGLTRIGDVVRLGKSAALQQVSIDVRDTISALPRFLSRTELSYSFESDTSVTIIVDYGGWEDLNFPVKGVRRLFLDDPLLYVCASKYGLWRRDIDKLTPWEYLGLADTTPNMGDGVLDVDAMGKDILVANFGRKSFNIDSSIAIWRSRDNGTTWFRSDSGVINTFNHSQEVNIITLVKRSPHMPNIVVAQYFNAALYLSNDSGKSWSILRGKRGILPKYGFLRWNPYSEGEFWEWGFGAVGLQSFCHVFENYGNTRRSNIGTDIGGSFAFNPDNKNHVFYAAYNLQETTDGGVTWKENELPKLGGMILIDFENIETPQKKYLILFAANADTPPHKAFILMRSVNDNKYWFLTGQPTVGNNLLVDKRHYLYWNWADHIRRMSIKEY